MMKYTVAAAAFALMGAEARVHSAYAEMKVENVKYRLERAFGKGLVGLYNEQGRFEPDRLGWAKKRRDGKPMLYSATQIAKEIFPGFTLDASSGTASILGFVNGMQYAGLKKESDIQLPGQAVELTNCFASTYSLIEDFDTLAYNISTFASESGTIKIFDVLALDPTHIAMDFSVEWEMCDVAAIFSQFKGMAGADYAALADNLSRELLVIVMDSPETFELIGQIKEAGECLVEVAADAGLSLEGGDDELFGDEGCDDGSCEQGLSEDQVKEDENRNDSSTGENEKKNDEEVFQSFATDAEIEEAKAAAKAAQGCLGAVDKYAVGELGGKLFAKFFDNELKANI